MIALLFLMGIGLWVVAAVALSKRIPRWVGVTRHATALSALLFPLMFVAPVADDVIGRWQFYRLCDKEAVLTLSPNWEKVQRARDNDDPIEKLKGYAIPISVQRTEFVDLDTNRPFLTFKAFHTYGGFLSRHLYGLDQSTSCWPKNLIQVTNKVNTDLLIKKGATQ